MPDCRMSDLRCHSPPSGSSVLDAEEDALGLERPSLPSAALGSASTAFAGAGNTDRNDAPETNADAKGKRSRGRPRMDTKDETAADRRRTQIRLAQRAYRHRKDTAITEFEQKVKEMEQLQDSIHKGFTKFYDILLAEGILDQVPHVAPRLRSIAADLLRLSSSAPSNDGVPQVSHGEGFAAMDLSQTTGDFDLGDTSVPYNPPMFHQGAHASHSTSPGTHTSLVAASSLSTASLPDVGSFHQPGRMEYEVIAEPTFQNATFSFSFPTSGSDHTQTGLSSSQDPHLSMAMSLASPYPRLPSPSSYAFFESTFSRRLHRITMELALKLANQANPPPIKFATVFGLMILFEDRESIVSRLAENLGKPLREDLHNRSLPAEKAPSVGQVAHIRGRYGVHELGNERPLQPGNMSPRRLGPMSPSEHDGQEAETRLRNLKPEFLFPSEVEELLNRLGIFIPATADYVEAELDLDALRRLSEPNSGAFKNRFQPQSHGAFDGGGAGALVPPSPLAAGLDPLQSDFGVPNAWTGGLSVGALSMPPAAFVYDASMAAGAALTQPVMGAEPFVPLMQMNAEAPSYTLQNLGQRVWPGPNKTRVVIDVSRLILETIRGSICLGRTPGVRQKHVVNALQIAAGLNGPL